jgi:hypothetical protein
MSGTTLFSGGGDGIVCAWDTATRQQLFSVSHAGPVTNLICVTRPIDLLKKDTDLGGALRPLPPLQKHQRIEHGGSSWTFLAPTSGVVSNNGGHNMLVKDGEVNSEGDGGELFGVGGKSVSGASASTDPSNNNASSPTDASVSMVARLAELENENLRWQTLATQLRKMLDEKNKKSSDVMQTKKRKK